MGDKWTMIVSALIHMDETDLKCEEVLHISVSMRT